MFLKKVKISALVMKESAKLATKGYTKEEMKNIADEIVTVINAHGKMTIEEATVLVKRLFAEY